MLRLMRLGDADSERLIPLSDREILLCTMVCKLRPDKAAKKYKLWLDSMGAFGIESFEDVYRGLDSEELWATMAPDMGMVFPPCGCDKAGRSVMWIRSRPVQLGTELHVARASCVYFTAKHADFVTLRNGVTFVMDTDKNDMTQRLGNERQLQRMWQSMPLRPQKFFILGAGLVKRVLINLVITLASYFTSESVISRIRFAEDEDVLEEVAVASMPAYKDGGGGGYTDDAQHLAWIRQRFRAFPTVTL
jgi:hypothetical protein